MIRTRTLAICLGLAMAGTGPLALAPAPATAADQAPSTMVDPVKEIETAATHAGLAAEAKDIKMVHTHLHHTINCLAGVHGPGYDATASNPCAGLGNGALVDAADAAAKTTLDAALEHAESGLKVDDLTTAQKIAAETQAQLRTVK